MKMFALAASCAALLGACGVEASDELEYQVTATYPHDPTSFTEGLEVEVDGSVLLEGTGRSSALLRVAITSGTFLDRVRLPTGQFGEGVTRFGDRIYQLTWKNNTCFTYAADSLAAQGTFAYEGEGWGLTHDDASLIMSNGSNVLTFRDPATFAVRTTIEVRDGGQPVDQLNELEWVRGEIWANVWFDTRIVRIDPESGDVIGRIELASLVPADAPADPDAVLNGIAYDVTRDRVYVTGKLWPVLYELEVFW